jgi:ribosomal protein S18 acetylase RimI-like enzyme
MSTSEACTAHACRERRQLTHISTGCWPKSSATALFSSPRLGGVFVGFAAGWIVEDNVIEETPDSNRFGLVSDVCVLAPYQGRRIAARLLDALSERPCHAGVQRIRLSVLAANRIAQAAYEHAGFTPYEVVYEKVVRTDGAQI